MSEEQQSDKFNFFSDMFNFFEDSQYREGNLINVKGFSKKPVFCRDATLEEDLEQLISKWCGEKGASLGVHTVKKALQEHVKHLEKIRKARVAFNKQQ